MGNTAKFLKCLYVVGAILSSAHAKTDYTDLLAYTQNNPPGQHQTQGTFTENHPLIFNGEALYGKIDVSEIRQSPISLQSGPVNTPNLEEQQFAIPNDSKWGLRIGLGMGLNKNKVNVSGQYSYLRSGNLEKVTPTAELPWLYNDYGSGFETDAADARTVHKGKLRARIFDLVAQSSSYMLGSKIRLQPLCGARYMAIDNNYKVKTYANQEQILAIETLGKIRLHGPFVGTDIKYMFYPSFYFFSSAVVGALQGHRSISNSLDLLSQNANIINVNPVQYRLSLFLEPFYIVRVGAAGLHLTDSDSLISLHLGMEFMKTNAFHAEFGFLGVVFVF